MSEKENRIMVVPSRIFEHEPRNVIHRTLTTPLWLGHYLWRLRSMMETDIHYRQVIPYVVLRNGPAIALMTRGKQQTESRLHAKEYIGVGGHIEYGSNVRHTAMKEIIEELGVLINNLTFVGWFYTDGDEVSDVHVALLFEAWTNDIEFESPEIQWHDARWATRDIIASQYNKLETWSQLVARDYLDIR